MSTPTLQELAEAIADSPIGKMPLSGSVVNYPAGNCIIQGIGILTVPPGADDLHPGASVQYCVLPAGAEIAEHVQDHGCTEWLHVLGGRLEVAVGDGTRYILCPGDAVRIEPGTPHAARALSDCTVLAVSVPTDGGYPHGPRPGYAGDVREGNE